MISENIPRNLRFSTFDVSADLTCLIRWKIVLGEKVRRPWNTQDSKQKIILRKKCIQTHFWISGSKQRKQRKTSTTYIFCCNYSIHKIVIGEFPFHAVWTLHSDRVNFLFLHLPIVYGTIECARIPPSWDDDPVCSQLLDFWMNKVIHSNWLMMLETCVSVRAFFTLFLREEMKKWKNGRKKWKKNKF